MWQAEDGNLIRKYMISPYLDIFNAGLINYLLT